MTDALQQGALLDVDPAARRVNDFYATPRWMTEALLRRIVIPGEFRGAPTRILEPCAGDGAIAQVIRDQGHVVETNDVDPEQHRATWHDDATNPQAMIWRRSKWDLVVTNPPFSLAEQIVPIAYEVARVGVIMLLRLSWLEPTENRAEFLVAHPPDTVIVLPRWSFRGVGSDSVTSAWFIWRKDWEVGCGKAGIVVVPRSEKGTRERSGRGPA